MYLTGVRPNPIPFAEGVPDVAGISGQGLALIKNNKTVSHAEVRLNLLGVVDKIENNTLTLINGESPPIAVRITDETVIFELAKDNQPKNLKLQDLTQNNVVQVSGRLEGSEVVADTLIREVSPTANQ